jgi:hypothetical protein
VPAYVNNLTKLEQGRAYWFISKAVAQVPYLP